VGVVIAPRSKDALCEKQLSGTVVAEPLRAGAKRTARVDIWLQTFEKLSAERYSTVLVALTAIVRSTALVGGANGADVGLDYNRWRICAARSPMTTHGAIVLVMGICGMIEPSAIRRLSTP
jgi:hypothetical protein